MSYKKKAAKRRTKKTQQLWVSLSEFRQQNLRPVKAGSLRGLSKAEIEAGYLPDSIEDQIILDLAVANDVLRLEEIFSKINFDADEVTKRWLRTLGNEGLSSFLTEAELKDMVRLTKKHHILLPEAWLPDYMVAKFPPVPFLPTLYNQGEEKNRSSGFEWVVLNKHSQDGEDHGATYTVDGVEVYDGDLEFNPSLPADEQKEARKGIPYARYGADFTILGWKDNKSFCLKAVRKNDPMTWVDRNGEDQKVLDIKVTKLFPRHEAVVDNYGRLVKYLELPGSKSVLLSDLIQRLVGSAGYDKNIWNQVRRLVDLMKEFKEALQEGRCAYVHDAGKPYWVYRLPGMVVYSPVTYNDLALEDRVRIQKVRQYWTDVNASKEALSVAEALKAKDDAGFGLNQEEVMNLIMAARKAYDLMQKREAWFLYNRIRPFMGLVRAKEVAKVDLSDIQL